MKCIGAASTIGLTGVVTASEPEVKVVTELRDLGNEVSQEEGVKIQKDELTSFTDSGRLVLGSARPKNNEVKIVGMTAAVNRDGETRQFIGATADDTRVSEVHDDVRSYARQFTEELSGQQVTTRVKSEEPWELFDDNVYKSYNYEGDVVSDSKVFNWTGSRSDYDRWGTHNTFKLTPADGGLGDSILTCQMDHDWSNYGGTGLAVVGNQPATSDNNAQIGVDMSLSSAPSGSIGFSYTQKSDVKRTVTQDPKVTNYDWQFVDFDHGEDTSQFDTGTEIAADKGSLGLQDALVTLDGNEQFYRNGVLYESGFNQFFELVSG